MNQNTTAVSKRMQALLAEIDYDFDQFTLEGFARWLERRRGRDIVFVPYPMEAPHMFGAWLAGDRHDYVFYEKNTASVHQAHIQLHEMAHMLCEHSATKVDSDELALALSQALKCPEVCNSLLLRSTPSDEAELEAETLATLIQAKVLRNSRLQELVRVLSSDYEEHFSHYVGMFDRQGA